MSPKILTLDIETAPATALVFGQYKQDISNIQIIKRDRVLGVGAKWLHEDKPMWRSEYHHGTERMVEWTRDLLDEADVAVHFNGGTFDMPWLRRAIAEQGLAPAAPVKEVDLLKVVRKQFRFMSNKLEAVLAFFDLDPKLGHSGFKMWRDIEVGDEDAQRKAWTLMRRYCKQDVISEEQLFLRLRQYIPLHWGLFNEDPSEPTCWQCNTPRFDPEGKDNFVKRGFSYKKRGKYQRYQCKTEGCHAWNEDKKAIAFVDAREAS